MRFEIDNDAIWDSDSNFSNGWSLQYHTKRYDTWDENQKNFPLEKSMSTNSVKFFRPRNY